MAKPFSWGWRKEIVLVNNKYRFMHTYSFIVVGFSFLGILLLFSQAASQDNDSQCFVIRDRWEMVHQDLKDKLNSYMSIQQLPVERVAQRPLVSNSTGKTIAKQVSDALQAKEDILVGKRNECRNLLNVENQAFAEMQECISTGRSGKNKDINGLHKKRRALIEKAILAITEVKEVEGRETILPYTEAGGQGDPYRRSVNNYWQNYQQNYRRWWGY